MPFVRTDQADEFPVPVEHRPDAGAFADGGLAAAARHRHREQSATQHGLLDLSDHLQVVGRPRQMKRQRKVRLAEERKSVAALRLADRGFDDFRQLADVATGRWRAPALRARARSLSVLVGVAVGFWFRFVANLHEPRGVPQQIDEPRIADPHAGSRAVAMQLPLVDHLAQRRGVQDAAEFARPQFAGISRHAPSPSRARRRNAPG